MSFELANASWVDDSNQSIHIIINGEPQVLTKDDCIQFNRYMEGGNILTIAKILGFGNSGKKINRIFFLPWRESGRWGTDILPERAIGLEKPYLLFGKPEWTTIKLVPCPEQSAGKYNNRKSTKQTRRSRKRQSRK
jgi:hypothetical protein